MRTEVRAIGVCAIQCLESRKTRIIDFLFIEHVGPAPMRTRCGLQISMLSYLPPSQIFFGIDAYTAGALSGRCQQPRWQLRQADRHVAVQFMTYFYPMWQPFVRFIFVTKFELGLDYVGFGLFCSG